MSYDELMEAYQKLQKDSKAEITNLEDKVLNLQLQVNTYQKMLFGSKREHTPRQEQIIDAKQCSLFEVKESDGLADELKEEVIEKTEEITVSNKKKVSKKRVAGIRKESLKDVEVEVIEYKLDDKENCPNCDSELKVVSKKIVNQEIEYIPAKIKVVNHVQYTYKCIACGNLNSNNESATFVKTNVPNPILTHSFVSASLAAEVMYQKYYLGVPLYRQESFWYDKCLVLPRNVLANWNIKLSEYYLKHLYSLMHEVILNTSELIHCDETTMQCNKEIGRKATTNSYMWVLRSGATEEKKGVIFKYAPNRSADIAKNFLKDYKGILVTDGFAAYNKIENISHAECWAHVRRKFYDSVPLLDNKKMDTTSEGYKGVEYCNKLFDIEREISTLSPEEKQIKRQELSKPVLEAFFEWVNSTLRDKIIVNDKLRKALTYSKNQQKELSEFLNNGLIPLSNNLAEQSIRPFATHRKNWLFADSVEGAETNAIIYSIVESAKVNNLNVAKYLEYLLANISQLEEPTNKMILKDFLPWSEKLPDEIKNYYVSNETIEFDESIEKLISKK